MLKSLRHDVIDSLWITYRQKTAQMQAILAKLTERLNKPITLDHLAIIDLPGPNSGIGTLSNMFSQLGFQKRGSGYLPDKQNDFLWMAETNCDELLADQALPQIVVADFRLEEMPAEIKQIILKYSQCTRPAPLGFELNLQNILAYLQGRDWPLPTVEEFKRVNHFNELLAWVLVFGRQPNHFTLSIHLHEEFSDLESFLSFVGTEVGLPLNTEGGLIKGTTMDGIAQASTQGMQEKVALQDGYINIPTGFVEFVWRFPKKNSLSAHAKWNEYFSGFVAQHANHVIESLYAE